AGRQAHETVRRPGEAIDAAMLAAAIGIDGPIEGNIGRIIAGDYAARLLDLDLRAEWLKVIEALPPVIGGFAALPLEAAARVEARATAAPTIDLDAQTGR